MYSVSKRMSPERLPLRNAAAARMSGGSVFTMRECTSSNASLAEDHLEIDA
jgi:hypothetical protein